MCESFDISSSKLYRTFCNCETYIEVKVVSNFLYLKLKKFVNCYVRCCSGGTSHQSERMSQHFFQRTQQVGARFQTSTRSVPYPIRRDLPLERTFADRCHVDSSLPLVRVEWSTDILRMRSGYGWLELCALDRSIPQSTKSTTSLDEDRRTPTRRSDGTNTSSDRPRRGALSMYPWPASRQQGNGRSAAVGGTDDDKSPGIARDTGYHSQPSRQERIWRQSSKSTNKPAWKEPEPVSQTVNNQAWFLSSFHMS